MCLQAAILTFVCGFPHTKHSGSNKCWGRKEKGGFPPCPCRQCQCFTRPPQKQAEAEGFGVSQSGDPEDQKPGQDWSPLIQAQIALASPDSPCNWAAPRKAAAHHAPLGPNARLWLLAALSAQNQSEVLSAEDGLQSTGVQTTRTSPSSGPRAASPTWGWTPGCTAGRSPWMRLALPWIQGWLVTAAESDTTGL